MPSHSGIPDAGSDPAEAVLRAFGDRLAAALKSGEERPCLGECLAEALNDHPELDRRGLLRELLLVELELLRGHGEDPQLGDYLAQYPEGDQEVVREALEEADRGELRQTMRYCDQKWFDKGGLGEILEARERGSNRVVAIKKIRPDKDNSINRARFLLEAEITARLEHPGIVPVHGIGYAPDGRPFYSMRLIEGTRLEAKIDELHRACRRRGSNLGGRMLELHKLLRKFLDICEAVHYAHSRGILHRDLKPKNIMIGPHGEALVLDWGLAKIMGQRGGGSSAATDRGASGGTSGETQDGWSLGTPGYMSPELACGAHDRVGTASDVYSLGAILYRLLAGQPAFGSSDPHSVLLKNQRGEFTPPQRVNPQVPKALEAICLKAMQLDPEDRYASARALVDDLERWLADEPVTAYAESRRERFARWIRKHPRATAVLLALAPVMTGALLVTNGARTAEKVARGEAVKALAAEKVARGEAVKALAAEKVARGEAEGLNTLLTEAFSRPHPVLDGYQVKAVTVLDQAVANLSTRFTGQPIIKARLLHDLGMTYLGLGVPTRATEVLTQARAVYEASLGPDHADTLTCCNDLGGAFHAAGRHAEAIKMHEGTLKLREAKLGTNHADSLASRVNLGVSYVVAGRPEEGVRLHEETLGRMTAVLGTDHDVTWACRNNLALGYYHAKMYDEAIKLQEATLARALAKLGPDHPDTLTSGNNLALSYNAKARYPEAIERYKETLDRRTKKLGADHLHTLVTRANLGVALRNYGVALRNAKMLEDGIRELEVALAIAGRRLDEGTRQLEEALEIARERSGSVPAQLAFAPPALADAYARERQFSKAEPILRDALKQFQAQFGDEDHRTVTAMVTLGRNLLLQKKYGDAESILRKCLSIREKVMPGSWNTFNTQSLLADTLLSQRKLAEAEPLALSGYEGMKAHEAEIPASSKDRLVEAAERIVRLYHEWGKPEKAAEWRGWLGLLPADLFAK